MVGSRDKGVFHSLFVTVFQITLRIIQISWLTQQGEADVLRATLVFHQGVIENHVLDASAMELSVWFILFRSLQVSGELEAAQNESQVLRPKNGLFLRASAHGFRFSTNSYYRWQVWSVCGRAHVLYVHRAGRSG